MVGVGAIAIPTTWIAAVLALYVVLVLLGLGVFSRGLARQVRMLETGDGETAAYAALDRRTTLSGALLVVVALVIVFLMVVKPIL